MKVLTAVFALLASVVLFELGMLVQQESKKPETVLTAAKITELSQQNSALVESKTELEEQLSQEVVEYKEQVAGLQTELDSTQTELEHLKALTKEEQNRYPFAVPTTGEIVTFNGAYAGNMLGIKHFGVDIWTSRENNGKLPGYKGNPVYSACDGKVVKIDPGNAAVIILCDPIAKDKNYNLPAFDKIHTYYGHMGHADSKQLYIIVGTGQRVKKGQKIGDQGNLSSYFPNSKNVHLHFGVFQEWNEVNWRKTGGPFNPCIYIGGNCSEVGQKFVAESI